MERALTWDGCVNVRDLGGLAAGDGVTRAGAVVRSDSPNRLSEAGWDSLLHYGVKTVVALRTEGIDDDGAVVPGAPKEVTVERVLLEDCRDLRFQRLCIESGWWATPLQWGVMLEHWPDRCAAAVRAVARARSGGVVVSCGIGRDRTGLVVFLLLSLVGVPVDVIASDWALSMECLVADPVAQELPVSEILESQGASVLVAVQRASDCGVQQRLIEGGLDRNDIELLRARLIGTR